MAVVWGKSFNKGAVAMASSSCLLYPFTAIENYEIGEFETDTDQILVPKRLWEKWTADEDNTTGVMILRLHRGSENDSEEQQEEVYVTVGGYHLDSQEGKEVFYCPTWVFQTFQQFSSVRYNRVTELPPSATSIVLKPLDNEFYHANIEEEISAYLSKWQSLKAGTTITVPIQELGGYPVDIFVERLEPESWCLLRGELPLELTKPLEDVVEWGGEEKETSVSATSTAGAQSQLETTNFWDTPTSMPPPQTKGFQAFSGTGYRLG